MKSIPDARRLAKGRILAATPGAVIRRHAYHHKVRSQSAPHYYDVRLLALKWRCGCPDFARGRGRACKHVLALREILSAAWEARRYRRAHHLTPEELLAQVEARLTAPQLSDHQRQRLQIYRSALTLPHVPFELRYWWRGADPEALFDPITGFTYPDPQDGIAVRASGADNWRPAATSAAQLRDYVLEHDLHIVDRTIVGTRRGCFGSWQGRFVLTFATNGHGQFDAAPQLQPTPAPVEVAR